MARATLTDLINRITNDIQENTSGNITATTMNELLDYLTNNLYLPTDSTVTVNTTAGIKEFTFGNGLTVAVDGVAGTAAISNPSAGVVDNGASFFASSVATVNIGSDSVTPAFLGPLTLDSATGITMTDAATGTMRNDSGRVISMTGTINYNPNVTGGGTTTLNIVSERSIDGGTTWVGNLESRRSMEINNTSESFGTKLSLILNWQPNQLLRFRAWVETGSITLESTSATALGQTFTSPSVVWELSET